MATVWVYVDLHADGTVPPSAFELLTKARDLGDEVAAVALGSGAKAASAQLGEYGASTVYAGDDAVFKEHLAQPAVEALYALVQEHRPNLILFPGSYDARDVAGRLQARTASTLMSNVSDIPSPDTAQTQIFGGTKIVDVELKGSDPKLLLVRPKAFEPESSGGGEAKVVPVEAQVPDEARQAKVMERHEEEASGPKLEDAPVIISGGRGLQDPKNFELLQDLAKALKKAAVGATRAVVDAGWVPYSMQIGQTGITVKPDVYIAIGISGATQHMVGMKESKRIIAINKDADAPIFKIADLGVVGDALKVIPAVTEKLKSEG
jgi:electron transfer flavoprotein alpha subunit